MVLIQVIGKDYFAVEGRDREYGFVFLFPAKHT